MIKLEETKLIWNLLSLDVLKYRMVYNSLFLLPAMDDDDDDDEIL